MKSFFIVTDYFSYCYLIDNITAFNTS